MAGSRNANLTFTVLGKDKSASKTLKGVGSEADKVGKRLGVMGVAVGSALGNLGAMAAAAGLSFAVDFGKQSVAAFTDAQRSQVKFESSLAKNGVGAYTAQIDELAQALALKTRFDDDATKSGAAVLANFGLTGKELAKVIPLVQDYAAFTGVDMTTASQKVGKALLGNTRALKELGINYKPTGDRARDLANIQALLNERVGGFAEKEGKSAAGQSAILANQFGELQEQVGSYLVPALQRLVSWLVTSVIPAVQKAADWVGKNLGPAFAALGKWVAETALPAMQDMATTFQRDVWPALQRVYAIVWTNLKPAIDSLAQLWQESLQPALVQALPFIQMWAKWFGVTWGAAMALGSWLIGKLVPIIAAVVSHIVKVTQMQGKVVAAFAGMAQGIYDAFKRAFNGIASLWNNTVGRLSFSVPSWVPGIGGKGFDVPDIPMLAKGGIVTRPTLALVGEAGTETVLPYDVRKHGGPGGGVTVYVTQPLGTPDQIARAVTDAFRKAGRAGGVNPAFG